MKIRLLTRTSDVIDALGGNRPFAKLISSAKKTRVDQHVSNYRRTGIFPPDTYLVVQGSLKKINCMAPASMWGITDPKAAPLKRAG